ncbi:MAG: 2-polyprenylphenol 6-hydroxylase [Parvularculaceae bacterium]
MLSAVADFARLLGAAFTLARRDAIVPREFAHLAPAPVRAFGALTRIGARTRENGRNLRPGERLALAFEGMSPPYVKLGQMLGTRPDIIGFEMAGDLGRLQDRMPPFSQAEAVSEIERTFGRPLKDIFEEFSEPIAAASIAQVHRAKLKDGREAAVKILRPRIEAIAANELRAFARAARLVERFSKTARRLEPVSFVDTLKAAATIELDLRLEAGAASALAEDMKSMPHVRIPEVIWPLSARRVLTTEWIAATPIADLAALDRAGADRRSLARNVIQTFLTQALHKGFFHADMHQGNLMVDAQGRLVLLDFGIMGRLDEKTRRTFAEIIHGFITRDYKRNAEVHFAAGYVPPGHSVDAFATALRSVGEPLFGKSADAVDMSRVLQQLFDVTALFDMHLRPELILLQRTMVATEGVARALDPSINLWEAATPVVRSYIADEIGPRRQARRLRDATLKAIEIAPRLPEYVERLGEAAKAAADSGGKSTTDKSADLARTIRREARLTRFAVVFAGLSALAAAAAALMR